MRSAMHSNVTSCRLSSSRRLNGSTVLIALRRSVHPRTLRTYVAMPTSVAAEQAIVEEKVEAVAAADPPQQDVTPQKSKARKQKQRSRKTSNEVLVGPDTKIASCGGHMAKLLRTKGTVNVRANTPEASSVVMKSLAITNRYLMEEGKCVVILAMQQQERKVGSVLTVVAGMAMAQDLETGTPVNIRSSSPVEGARHKIVAKVANYEPVAIQAAGKPAIEIAVQAVIAAQGRLSQLGYEIGLVPIMMGQGTLKSPRATGSAKKTPPPSSSTSTQEATAADTGPASTDTDSASSTVSESSTSSSGTLESTQESPASPTSSSSGSTTDGGDGGTSGAADRKPYGGFLQLNVVLLATSPSQPPPPPAGDARPARPVEDGGVNPLFKEEGEQAGSSEDSVTSQAAFQVTADVLADTLRGQLLRELKRTNAAQLVFAAADSSTAVRALTSVSFFLGSSVLASPASACYTIAASSRDGSYIINIAREAPSQEAPPPKMLENPIKVAATSEANAVSVSLAIRAKRDGWAVMRFTTGKNAATAMGALVAARDKLQAEQKDFSFSLYGEKVQVNNALVSMATVVVRTHSLQA